MTGGTSRSIVRRMADVRFATRYFVGDGIDIGSGTDSIKQYQHLFPQITSVKTWDWLDGDAQKMVGVPDETYDFVVSSHCLEHLYDPHDGMLNWSRILKKDGHLIIVVPDEDLYEQKHWPSQFNSDHKTSWTIQKHQSWSPVSINCVDFFRKYTDLEIIKMELLDSTYDYFPPRKARRLRALDG